MKIKIKLQLHYLKKKKFIFGVKTKHKQCPKKCFKQLGILCTCPFIHRLGLKHLILRTEYLITSPVRRNPD